MAAITWRNIDAPDFSGASRMMGESQRMLDSGFGKLGQIIEQQQKQDQINAVAERTTNTSKYLDSVAALAQQGPGALEEAIKSGAVNKLRESFGPNIDADRVRGAAEQMLAQRMQQSRQATEFNNFMVDEAQKPIRDAWRVAGLKGDKAKQAELEAQNPNLRNMAELYQSQRNIDHENLVWDEEKKDWVRRQGKYEQDIKASNAQIAYQQGSLENARANTQLSRERLNMDKADRKEERDFRAEERLHKMLVETQEKYGATFQNNPNSADSIKDQLANINKLPESARELAMKAVTAARAQPGATQGSVLAAMMSPLTPEYLSTDGGQIKRAVAAGDTVRLANAASGEGVANEVRQGILGNRMKDIQSRLSVLRGETPAGTKSNAPVPANVTISDPEAERALAEVRERVLKGSAPAQAGSYGPNGFVPTESAPKLTPAQQVSAQFGKEGQAKREADYQAKLQAREQVERAAAQQREATRLARVAEGEERGRRAQEAQAKRYAEAATQRAAAKAERQAQKVAEAEANLRMMQERARLSGAPIHKANLKDAEEELRRLTKK